MWPKKKKENLVTRPRDGQNTEEQTSNEHIFHLLPKWHLFITTQHVLRFYASGSALRRNELMPEDMSTLKTYRKGSPKPKVNIKALHNDCRN